MGVEIFEGRIPYLRVGEAGAPLVMIRGGQGFVRRTDSLRFERDALRTARLLPFGQRLVLIGYDPSPPADLSADSLVGDLARFIESQFAGPVALAGTSFGGMIAVRLAARRPDLISKLIMISTAHRFSDQGLRRIQRQIDALRANAPADFMAQFARLFRRPWFNALVALRLSLGGRGLAEGLASPDVIIAYLAAMRDAGPVDLPAIKAPALIIGGQADQFYGDGVMEEAAAAISQAQLELQAGETHMMPVERRRMVASCIARFLAS